MSERNNSMTSGLWGQYDSPESLREAQKGASQRYSGQAVDHTLKAQKVFSEIESRQIDREYVTTKRGTVLTFEAYCKLPLVKDKSKDEQRKLYKKYIASKEPERKRNGKTLDFSMADENGIMWEFSVLSTDFFPATDFHWHPERYRFVFNKAGSFPVGIEDITRVNRFEAGVAFWRLKEARRFQTDGEKSKTHKLAGIPGKTRPIKDEKGDVKKDAMGNVYTETVKDPVSVGKVFNELCQKIRTAEVFSAVEKRKKEAKKSGKQPEIQIFKR